MGELMHASKLVGSEYYRSTAAVTLAGLFFIVMSLIAAVLVRMVETRVKICIAAQRTHERVPGQGPRSELTGRLQDTGDRRAHSFCNACRSRPAIRDRFPNPRLERPTCDISRTYSCFRSISYRPAP